MTYIRRLNQARDNSEPEIVQEFEKEGGFVIRGELIDLFVNLYGEWFAVECKTGKKKLQPHQAELQAKLDNTYVCRSAAEARYIIQDRQHRIRKWPRKVINILGEGPSVSVRDGETPVRPLGEVVRAGMGDQSVPGSQSPGTPQAQRARSDRGGRRTRRAATVRRRATA